MIYLVRHGQTDWNLFKRFNGTTDVYLNQTGIVQAKQQADKLKNVVFDACFCSPLTRARQFCEMLYNGPIVFDDRLIEIDCGAFEGTEETAESMRLFWKAVQSGDKGTGRIDAFIKRNCDLCDTIVRDYKGKNVLVVTHAANARIVNYYFTGRPNDYDFTRAVCEAGGLLILDNG